MFVIEAAIHHAAREIGVEPHVIQERNLLEEGSELPYGQKTENCEARKCWVQAKRNYQLEELKEQVQQYNSTNKYSKKGLALMPVCFGISFTNTMMNNARALVHVYSDGSVGAVSYTHLTLPTICSV